MDVHQVNSRALHDDHELNFYDIADSPTTNNNNDSNDPVAATTGGEQIGSDDVRHRGGDDAKDFYYKDNGNDGEQRGEKKGGFLHHPAYSTTNNDDGNADDDAGNNNNEGTDLEPRRTAASNATSIPEWYPEGGREAWSVVLGAWFAMFSALGMLNTLATFQAYTLRHQLRGYNEGTVGWIFSIYTFLAFFCGVYIGPIFDKYGPRWLVLAGMVCLVGGIVALSFCTELWHFILSFGVLMGLGTSLLFTPCIASVGHWFKARRGLATGIASTAGGVGGVVFPLMLTALFERLSYGWSVRVLALLCLVCSGTGVLLVRARLPPAPNARAHPDLRIFRQLPFFFVTIGIFLFEFSLFVPLTYVSSYAMHAGFSEQFAYHLLPIMNAASAVGRVLPGYYSDIIGPINTCILAVVISLIACVGIWLPAGHTLPGIVIFSLLFGFGSGTNIAIAPVCIGQMCKTQNYGRYYATCYTVVSFACLIDIPIAGNIVKANNGSYTGLIAITSAVYVVSIVFLFMAKMWKLGWQGWKAAY